MSELTVPPKRYIIAEMKREELDNMSFSSMIPYVVEGNHPRFTRGTRLDWGFVQVAIEEGYELTIRPHQLNRRTCKHHAGFDRTSMGMSRGKNEYSQYWCPMCQHCRYILVSKDRPLHLPTDHDWDYIEDDY